MAVQTNIQRQRFQIMVGNKKMEGKTDVSDTLPASVLWGTGIPEMAVIHLKSMSQRVQHSERRRP